MKPLSRRAVLKGVGGVTIGLPFLSAMLAPRKSYAADVPKRFVAMFSANGTIPNRWRPTGGETDFALSEILNPLERHRDDLLIIKGVNMETAIHASGGNNGHDIGTGHALAPWPLQAGDSGVGEFGHLWDGSAGGPSLDQYIAQKIGSSYAFSSLVYGHRCDIRQAIPARVSWRGAFDAVRPMQETGVAFDRVFGAGVDESASLADYRKQRGSVVDAVIDDYHRLYNKLGKGDQRRLEGHMTSLRSLEQSIDGLESLGDCTTPDRVDVSDYNRVMTANQQMLAAALACELTPVGVLQWGSGQSGLTLDGHGNNHHSLSHEPNSEGGAQNQIVEHNRYYADMLAKFIDLLKGFEAGDGTTVFDNTTILWVNELGIGNTHTRTDIPYVIAGSCQGAINTGRYIQRDGRAHGELFTSVLNAMDIPDATFGVPEYCDGPLPGVLA